MRLLAGLILASALCAADNVYVAPSPEPTAEETLTLELINRCRADPKAEGLRIAPVGANPQVRSSTSVDFDMFRREMAAIAPSAPLVFDLRLLDAARKHSHYMILHEQGHEEKPGSPGFTGVDLAVRTRAAGWPAGGPVGENVFREPVDALSSHLGFVIDWGPGPGGMQTERGHRAHITDPRFTCAGIGIVPHPGKLSVTHDFSMDGKRRAGGVAYVDRDGDGFYSLGEGHGAVTVQVAGQRVVNWGSGAYAIEIPITASAMTLRSGGVEITRPIPAGTDNVKIDWVIPQEQDLATADKLLAAVEAAKDPASTAARKALVALLVGTEGLALDEARASRVRELTGELATALTADRAAVREALGGEARAAKKIIDARAKAWKGTLVAGWFAEAELCLRAASAWAEIPAHAPLTRLRAVAKELRASATGAEVGEFRAKLDVLALAAEAAVREK